MSPPPGTAGLAGIPPPLPSRPLPSPPKFSYHSRRPPSRPPPLPRPRPTLGLPRPPVRHTQSIVFPAGDWWGHERHCAALTRSTSDNHRYHSRRSPLYIRLLLQLDDGEIWQPRERAVDGTLSGNPSFVGRSKAPVFYFKVRPPACPRPHPSTLTALPLALDRNPASD